MKARPSFQFYPSDWLRDPCLRSCSLGARGLWIDMLAFMHEAEPYGHLRLNNRDITVQALARMVGIALKEVCRLLDELEAAGVFSRTETGTVYSRRMVRDEELRVKRGQYGHLALNNPAVPRKKDGGKDTLKDTFPLSMGGSNGGSPSSSSSSSSSEKKEKRDTAASPSLSDFENFWNSFPMRDGRRLGKAEALRKWETLHATDRELVLVAVRNYAGSKQVSDGIGIKDAHRWLRNGKKDEPWREWIEPGQPLALNGHALLCAKRVQRGQFLKPCGKPAAPGSRAEDPRCLEHLAVMAERNGHAH